MKKNNIITRGWVVKPGSLYDAAGRSGFAHLMEHVLIDDWRGNMLPGLEGRILFDGLTTREFVLFWVKGAQDDVLLAGKALEQTVKQPRRAKKEEVAKHAKVVMQEEVESNSKENQIFRESDKLLFLGADSLSPRGIAQQIQDVSLEEILQWQRQLAIAFEITVTGSMVRVKPWKNQHALLAKSTTTGTNKKWAHDTAGVVIAFLSKKPSEKGLAHMEYLRDYFANSWAAALNHELRDKGKAYWVTGWTEVVEDRAVLRFHTFCKRSEASRIAMIIEEVIKKHTKRAEFLNEAKIRMFRLIGEQRQEAQVEKIIRAAFDVVAYGEYQSPEKQEVLLQNTTKKELQEFAKKLFKNPIAIILK